MSGLLHSAKRAAQTAMVSARPSATREGWPSMWRRCQNKSARHVPCAIDACRCHPPGCDVGDAQRSSLLEIGVAEQHRMLCRALLVAQGARGLQKSVPDDVNVSNGFSRVLVPANHCRGWIFYTRCTGVSMLTAETNESMSAVLEEQTNKNAVASHRGPFVLFHPVQESH